MKGASCHNSKMLKLFHGLFVIRIAGSEQRFHGLFLFRMTGSGPL